MLYGDNVAAIGLAHGTSNASWRTRHLRIRSSYLREALEGRAPGGMWRLLHLRGKELVADGLTKPLQGQAFASFLTDLGMQQQQQPQQDRRDDDERSGSRNAAVMTLVAGSMLLSGTDSVPEDDGDADSQVIWTCGAILMALGAIYAGQLAFSGAKCCLKRLYGPSHREEDRHRQLLVEKDSGEEVLVKFQRSEGSSSNQSSTPVRFTTQSGSQHRDGSPSPMTRSGLQQRGESTFMSSRSGLQQHGESTSMSSRSGLQQHGESTSMSSRSGLQQHGESTSMSSRSGLQHCGESSMSSRSGLQHCGESSMSSRSGLQHCGESSMSSRSGLQRCGESTSSSSRSGLQQRGEATSSKTSSGLLQRGSISSSLTSGGSHEVFAAAAADSLSPEVASSSSAPKQSQVSNPWNQFQKEYKGKGLSSSTLAKIYKIIQV